MSSDQNRNDPYFMYIYQLPYAERKALCRILDMRSDWETLGGEHMKFDVGTLHQVGQAVLRYRSPTDELLSSWGTQNHTVLELFVLLSRMQHYQAMGILKPLVSPKYHCLIYEGEENLGRMMSPNKKEVIPEQSSVDNTVNKQVNTGKDFAFGEHNLNVGHTAQASAGKNLFEKTLHISKDEAKILNTPEKEINNKDQEVKKKLSIESNLFQSEGLTPIIRYAELEVATGDWDRRNILGKGGFGTVFKGTWKNTEVAIKRLEVQKGGDLEEVWKTQREQSLRELRYLNSCRHDNILPLYGYSIGGPHDCLVYQYMPKGSLEDRLLCRKGSIPLSWAQRHNIAVGIARGLQFLHSQEIPLVHGDIKSANILLDNHLEPKIGDFGLAREGPMQQYTHVKVSRVHGTRPYLPDEFLRSKKFSTKVDTYSFGIVLFELATGLRAYDESRNYKFLKDHIEGLGNDRINEVCDLKAGPDDCHLFPEMVSLGKLCVSSRPKDRPEMVLVMKTLNSMSVTKDVHQLAQDFVRQNSLNPGPPFEPWIPNPTMVGGIGLNTPRGHSPQPFIAYLPVAPPNPQGPASKSNDCAIRIPQAINIKSDARNEQPSCSNLPSPPIAIQPPSALRVSEIIPHEEIQLPDLSELGIKSDSDNAGKSSS